MPRLKGNTKEIILEKSLVLFSTKGFEAVSIRDIAAEVGIGNSALYKHYASKQAIFDALVAELKEEYLQSCSFVSEEIRGVDAVKTLFGVFLIGVGLDGLLAGKHFLHETVHHPVGF